MIDWLRWLLDLPDAPMRLQDKHIALLNAHLDLQARYEQLLDQLLASLTELLEWKQVGAQIDAQARALLTDDDRSR